MAKLSEPSAELASRLRREVEYKERLIGFKMTPMSGNRETSIYGFKEAVHFLHMDSLEDLMILGSGASVGYIDLQQLSRWVREVFGDAELAAEMDRQIAKNASYMENVLVLKKLMRQRLDQCKQIVG